MLFHRPITGDVGRPEVAGPVLCVVKVEVFTGRNRFVTAGTFRHTSFDQHPIMLPQCPMILVISALRGGGLGPPTAPSAVWTAATTVFGHRPGGTALAIDADARLRECHRRVGYLPSRRMINGT